MAEPTRAQALAALAAIRTHCARRIAQCRADELKFGSSKPTSIRQSTTQVSAVAIEAAIERRALQAVEKLAALDR